MRPKSNSQQEPQLHNKTLSSTKIHGDSKVATVGLCKEKAAWNHRTYHSKNDQEMHAHLHGFVVKHDFHAVQRVVWSSLPGGSPCWKMPRGCCVDRHPAMPLLLRAASPIDLQSYQLTCRSWSCPIPNQRPFYQNNSMEKVFVRCLLAWSLFLPKDRSAIKPGLLQLLLVFKRKIIRLANAQKYVPWERGGIVILHKTTKLLWSTTCTWENYHPLTCMILSMSKIETYQYWNITYI